MTTKQYLWAVLVVSASLLGIVSCSKSEEPQAPTPTTTEEVAPEGEIVEVDFAGLYDTSAPASELRYIGTTSEQGIKISLSASELASPKQLCLHLVQEENPSIVTTIYVTPTIEEISSGKYRIIYKGPVQLRGAGQTFASGTWYVGGVYGMESSNTIFSLPNNSQYAFWENGKEVELTLPLVLGWTRVYTKAKPAPATEADTHATQTDMTPLSPDLGRNFALRYRPDGILLRVRAINGLLSHTPISHVVLETDEFSAGSAKYPPVSGVTVQQLQSGTTPSTLTAINTTSKVKIEATIPSDIRFVSSGEAVSKDAYFWLHTTSRTYDAATKTRLWLNASSPNGRNPDWSGTWQIENRLLGKNPDGSLRFETYPSYDCVNHSPRGENQYNRGAVKYRLYGGERSYLLKKKTAASGYIGGRIYPVNMEVASDLIMSELFVSRDYQDPHSNNPSACSALLEIYNPTLREIDLAHYGLVRIFTRNTTNNQGLCPGVSVPNGYPGDHIDKALVLPLNPAADYGSNWTPNSLCVRPDGDNWNGDNAYLHSTRPNHEGYPIAYRDYAPVVGSQPLTASSTLAPGKTMIILSSTYLLNESEYTPNITRDAYVTVGGKRVAEVFTQIKKAVDQGYCQYVFAANNAKDASARPNAAGAGVMTVGLTDFFTVVKVKTNKQRTIVDSDWVYKWYHMQRDYQLFEQKPSLRGYVRKRRLPLLGNTSILFSQEYINRTEYTVGGANNFSTFGVSESNEYQDGWTYNDRIQPLIDRRDHSKIH